MSCWPERVLSRTTRGVGWAGDASGRSPIGRTNPTHVPHRDVRALGRVAALPQLKHVPTVQDMATGLLTEGDIDRGRPPDLTSPHWRCGIVHAASGAGCTRRPHGDDVKHQGYEAVQGAGRSTRLAQWNGGAERALVVDGYTWSRLPGTEVEVRPLTDRPLAIRLSTI